MTGFRFVTKGRDAHRSGGFDLSGVFAVRRFIRTNVIVNPSQIPVFHFPLTASKQVSLP
jgi:hypothetical protein